MNTDIRSEILKQLDIDDLSVLCLTDENFYHICNRKEFWHTYFDHYQLKLPNDVKGIKEWIKLFKYVRDIDLQTHQILNELVGPIKFRGFANIFRSKTLYATDLDKITIDNEQANQLVLDFYDSLTGDNKPSFRMAIAYHKDQYLLELEGDNIDTHLPFNDMLAMYNKTYKQIAYTINKDIAYQYIFAIFYYQLQG